MQPTVSTLVRHGREHDEPRIGLGVMGASPKARQVLSAEQHQSPQGATRTDASAQSDGAPSLPMRTRSPMREFEDQAHAGTPATSTTIQEPVGAEPEERQQPALQIVAAESSAVVDHARPIRLSSNFPEYDAQALYECEAMCGTHGARTSAHRSSKPPPPSGKRPLDAVRIQERGATPPKCTAPANVQQSSRFEVERTCFEVYRGEGDWLQPQYTSLVSRTLAKSTEEVLAAAAAADLQAADRFKEQAAAQRQMALAQAQLRSEQDRLMHQDALRQAKELQEQIDEANELLLKRATERENATKRLLAAHPSAISGAAMAVAQELTRPPGEEASTEAPSISDAASLSRNWTRGLGISSGPAPASLGVLPWGGVHSTSGEVAASRPWLQRSFTARDLADEASGSTARSALDNAKQLGSPRPPSLSGVQSARVGAGQTTHECSPALATIPTRPSKPPRLEAESKAATSSRNASSGIASSSMGTPVDLRRTGSTRRGPRVAAAAVDHISPVTAALVDDRKSAETSSKGELQSSLPSSLHWSWK